MCWFFEPMWSAAPELFFWFVAFNGTVDCEERAIASLRLTDPDNVGGTMTPPLFLNPFVGYGRRLFEIHMMVGYD